MSRRGQIACRSWSRGGLLRRSEDYVTISFGDQAISFLDVGLDVVNRLETGNLSFRVFTENESRRYEVIFVGEKIDYRPLDGDLTINFGRRRSLPLSVYFQDEPPVLYFDNGGFLMYNRYAELNLAENRRSTVPGLSHGTGRALIYRSSPNASKSAKTQYNIALSRRSYPLRGMYHTTL